MERLSFVLRRASGGLVAIYLVWWLWTWAARGELFFLRGLWTRGPIAVSAVRDQHTGDVASRRSHFKRAVAVATLLAVFHLPFLFGVL